MGLTLSTKRHDSVLTLLARLLQRKGLQVSVNRALPGQRLRPDIELDLSGSRVLIDVAVSYDTTPNLEAAFHRKVSKYEALGRIFPLVVGSLGAWFPRNDDIKSILGIDGRSWSAFRQKARVAAVKGSTCIIASHLSGSDPGLEEQPPASSPPASDHTDDDDQPNGDNEENGSDEA